MLFLIVRGVNAFAAVFGGHQGGMRCCIGSMQVLLLMLWQVPQLLWMLSMLMLLLLLLFSSPFALFIF